MEQSNKNKTPCQVCGHPTARLTFCSFVCNACRVFFSRHCNSNSALQCDNNGTCQISYLRQRMNCAACRLKKCYDLNMSSGQAVVKAFYDSYLEMRHLTEMYGEIMNSGFKVVGYLQNKQSNNAWIDCLMHFDHNLLAAGGRSPSACVANTSMTLNDCLMFPGSCMDRTTAVFDSLAVVEPSLPYKYKELVHFLTKQMTFIEEFHQMLPVDRIRLLKLNHYKFSSYILLFLKLTKGWDAQANLQYMQRFKMADNVGPQYNRILAIWTSPTGIKICGAMEELQPTAKEWLLLRVLAMFRPCPSMSTDGYTLALKVRLKITYRLAEYIREAHSNLTPEQIRERLLKLIELESDIETYGHIIHDVFVCITLNHSSGWGTQLLHDLFVRQF